MEKDKIDNVSAGVLTPEMVEFARKRAVETGIKYNNDDLRTQAWIKQYMEKLRKLPVKE